MSGSNTEDFFNMEDFFSMARESQSYDPNSTHHSYETPTNPTQDHQDSSSPFNLHRENSADSNTHNMSELFDRETFELPDTPTDFMPHTDNIADLQDDNQSPHESPYSSTDGDRNGDRDGDRDRDNETEEHDSLSQEDIHDILDSVQDLGFEKSPFSSFDTEESVFEQNPFSDSSHEIFPDSLGHTQDLGHGDMFENLDIKEVISEIDIFDF